MERRLAAILAADVVGYSRLIRADEEGTLDRLKALRNEIIDPKIAEHNGRIVKLMGDGMLVEFASVVDAVRAAAEAQRSITEHNAGLPEEMRIEFRIGINLGDVVIDGDDIHGDGVNVAARLEGLANPGSICVSDAVHDQVRDRLNLAFEDLGEQEVKNIDRPVRVWRWRSDMAMEEVAPRITKSLPLPDKPSIAVLPFVNMSDDPEQEYFSDGITEDIITELSRFRSLFVIARNSSFTFKGQAVGVTEVGRSLGVQYVVEGSVRKAANRVRVTAQLVEAETGIHIWAERWDRELEDIFAVQDELVATIVATLPVRVDDARVEHRRQIPTDSLPAYDCILRGNKHIRNYRRQDVAEARAAYERALALDSKSALAHAGLANVYIGEYFWGDFEARRTAVEFGERALALDRNDPRVIGALATPLCKNQRADEAVKLLQHAMTIAPGNAGIASLMGVSLVHAGRHDEAIQWLEKAIRLDPLQPTWAFEFLGEAHYLEHRFDDAIEAYERIADPPHWICTYLAASYAMNGNDAAAQEQVKMYARVIEREFEGQMTTEQTMESSLRDLALYKRTEDTQLLIDGFRKAGLSV